MNPTTESPDTPVFAVDESALVPVNDYLTHMTPIPVSRMFMIKQLLDRFKANHPDTPMYDASQGDGGASLPGVPGELLERAFQLHRDHGTAYDQPFGTPQFRKAVVESYWKLDAATGWGPANVIATQGGRDALIKAYMAMLHLGHGRIGDVIVTSRVPWISYNWGPYGIGANVLRAPGRAEEGWQYSEDGLRETVAFAERAGGRKVAGLIITSPDNPTGHTLTVERQVELGKAAMRLGVPFVLYDWIYHWVTAGAPVDVNAFLTAFTPDERERIMILDGLTKSLGASNVRNAHLLASERVCKFIQSYASHGVIPSFYSLAVAIAAYEMGYAEAAKGIIGPTNESRVVLDAFLEEHNFDYIIGTGGYYAFINCERWIRAAGMADSVALGEYLAAEHGVAVVAGAFFSDAGRYWMRFSYALPKEKTLAAAQRFLEGLNALEARA
mgnify:CR=1 FL=1